MANPIISQFKGLDYNVNFAIGPIVVNEGDRVLKSDNCIFENNRIAYAYVQIWYVR